MSDLRTAAQQALEAWDGGDTEWFKRAYTVMEALRAALTEPVQEPVAVVRSVVSRGEDGVNIKWLRGFPQIGDRLYAAPPQRKPLTEEEIDSIWDSEKAFADIYAIARAIERAHGITEEMK